MAGPRQREFVSTQVTRFEARLQSERFQNVLEVGSQNINGSARDWVEDSKSKTWIGIDLGEAPGVDMVCPAEFAQIESGWSDLSISCECFEHASNWKLILDNMIRISRPGGLIVLTFAGSGRGTHGTLDTSPGASPFTQSYYKNISANDFMQNACLDQYFSEYSIEVDNVGFATRFWGFKKGDSQQDQSKATEELLARTRGQLTRHLEENIELKKQLSIAKMSPALLAYKFARLTWRKLRF